MCRSKKEQIVIVKSLTLKQSRDCWSSSLYFSSLFLKLLLVVKPSSYIWLPPFLLALVRNWLSLCFPNCLQLLPSPSLHLSYWPVRLPPQPAIHPGPNIDSVVLSQATCSLPLILITEDLGIKRKKQTAAYLAPLTVCWVSLLSLSPLSHLSPQLFQNLSIHSSLLPVCCVRTNLHNCLCRGWIMEVMAPKSALLLRTPLCGGRQRPESVSHGNPFAWTTF